MDRLDKQYYIDRSGKIHKLDINNIDYKIDDIVSFHYEIAKQIYPDVKSPDDVLMNLGWVMVGSCVYSIPIIHKKPTQAQLNKLDKLGLYDRLCFLHDGYYPNYKKYGILMK